jgi:hypothetical protein
MTGRVTARGTAAVRALGVVSPLARHGAEMIYQFEMPFVVDGSRFLQAFGAKVTPLEDAVRGTLDWYRANPSSRSRPAGETHRFRRAGARRSLINPIARSSSAQRRGSRQGDRCFTSSG